MLLRQRAYDIALHFANSGVREKGGNNRGYWVRKFLASTGLPEGYPWCAAFVSYCLIQAAKGHRTGIESAGVAVVYREAKKRGWVVDRPYHADLVLFDWDGDGQFDDHIGFVRRVVRLGPVMILKTVEGNTSSGNEGSQDDGGGVWARTRLISRKRVAFVRVPGNVPVPVAVMKKQKTR